jgi:SAM-dependent methyltransferase
MDVNTADFPGGPFDLIVNFSAAHHVQRVDRVFRALRDLLEPDGFFAYYDYVGPHRNQYGWSAWEAAHVANQQLPAEARQVLRYPHLPTMLADDPTEAIHSELVLEIMGRYFEIDDYTPVGGAVAYMLLTHNAQLFALQPSDRLRWAEEVMAADADYLAAHPEDTLFAYWVARPRGGLVADQAQLDRWTSEEEAREAAAAENGGEYYPHTALQALTLELAHQTILAEHRTAWAYDLRDEVGSLKAQVESLKAQLKPVNTELRFVVEARRVSRGLVRRLVTFRHRP